MLLVEWVRSLGLPCEAKRFRLSEVKRFVFGERYFVEMNDGRCYEDKDLERLLAVMHDEVHVHNTTVLLRTGEPDTNETVHLLVQLAAGNPTSKDPLGKADQRVLQVIPMFNGVFNASAGVLPPPEPEGVVTAVRQAVVFYNLSGNWTQFKKDNL